MTTTPLIHTTHALEIQVETSWPTWSPFTRHDMTSEHDNSESFDDRSVQRGFLHSRLSNSACALVVMTLLYATIPSFLSAVIFGWRLKLLIGSLLSIFLSLLLYERLTIRFAKKCLRSRCSSCGYYLYDSATHRCPECGHSVGETRQRYAQFIVGIFTYLIVAICMITATGFGPVSPHAALRNVIAYLSAALWIPFVCAIIMFDYCAFQRRWSLRTYCQRCGSACIGDTGPVCERCLKCGKGTHLVLERKEA